MDDHGTINQRPSWALYQLRTFVFAFKGLTTFFKTETKAIIHTVAALFAIIAGFLLKISLAQWGLIIIVIGIVFISELINTSIEKLVDMVSPEHDLRAGQIKDIAAGAVLMASLVALVTGIVIFVPAILNLFKTNHYL